MEQETMNEQEADAAEADAAEQAAKAERLEQAYQIRRTRQAREDRKGRAAHLREELDGEEPALRLFDEWEAALEGYVKSTGLPREQALNVLRRCPMRGSYGFAGLTPEHVLQAIGDWRERIQQRIARLQEQLAALEQD